MKELEQAREVFLSDVDEETYKENLAKIIEWERSINQNSAYLAWRDHDITRQVNKMVRDAYKDIAITLGTNRMIDEEQRLTLYAKQDACLFILSLTDQNAKSALEGVLREIRHALTVTT